MATRKRWFAELAGTFLLCAEEVAENPPWKAYILRRPLLGVTEDSAGNLIECQIPAVKGHNFIARSEKIAMDAAETTIRNSYRNYAHRLGEMKWQERNVSDQEWDERCAQFIRGA